MKFTKQTSSGAWIPKESIEKGTRIKIMTEAKTEEGNYGPEVRAKVLVQGEKEPVNCKILTASMNAFIDAWGDDSEGWVGKIVTAHPIDATRGISLYLIPEGYKLTRDDGGFIVIVKEGSEQKKDDGIPIIDEEEEPDPKDIPF